MKQIAHEIYDSSYHYWYQVDLTQEHHYGRVMDLGPDKQSILISTMKQDLANNPQGKVHFWYFGPDLQSTQVMVRVKDGLWDLQVNLKDLDFALNIDRVNDQKRSLLQSLKTQ
ncbi:TPA: hypothetical protein ACGO1T_000949 [Streptococcus suis]